MEPRPEYRNRLRSNLVSLRDLVCVQFTGEDRRTWLQGQTTQDVLSVRQHESVGAAFVSMTGHCESLGVLVPGNDCDWYITEERAAEHVLERVENYVILEDVEARILNVNIAFDLLDGRFRGIGRQEWRFDVYENLRPDLDHAGKFEHLGPRFHSPTYRDYSSKVLLPELGVVVLNQVLAKNKGCYVGQEVIHRILARGHTNRTWRVGQVIGEPPLCMKHEFGTVLTAMSDLFTVMLDNRYSEQYLFEWPHGQGRLFLESGVTQL